MKVVLQRVKSGSVEVNNKIISQIDDGLVLLWGVKKGDTHQDADTLINKIVNLRIFSDDFNKMNKSVQDVNGDILLVSQFTLLADSSKGNRPSFINAEEPQKAAHILSYVAKELSKYVNVKEGIFGADMTVSIINDGPVTITLQTEHGILLD